MKHTQFHVLNSTRNPEDHPTPRYIAVRDGLFIGCTGFTGRIEIALSEWCKRYIEQGCTIYRADTWFAVRYIGDKIPPEELAKLELAVTAVLEGV
jgi:hypothetical protein